MSGTGPTGGAEQAPKIIIDSDWKTQAQAEKEKLAAADQAKKAAQSRPGSPDEPPQHEGPLGIQDIISLLVSQALMYLGAVPDPASGRAVVAPEYAKLYIDMLGVLEEKTKGNLTEAESKLLSRALNELRMEFVDITNYVQKAIAEGKIKPGAPAVGGMGGGAAGLAGAAGSVAMPGVTVPKSAPAASPPPGIP